MIYVHKTYWAPDTPNQWSPRIAKTDHSYPSFCCSVVAPQVNSLNKVKLFCWNYACCYCVIDVFFYCLLLWERWWHHTQHTPFPQKQAKQRSVLGALEIRGIRHTWWSFPRALHCECYGCKIWLILKQEVLHVKHNRHFVSNDLWWGIMELEDDRSVVIAVKVTFG